MTFSLTRKRLAVLLISAFACNTALVAFIALSISRPQQIEERWCFVSLSALLVVNFLFSKTLWRFIDASLLLPLEMLKKESLTSINTDHAGSAEVAHFCASLGGSMTESRERERLIADYSGEVICSCNVTMDVLAVNPTVYKQWGYPQAGLIGKNLSKIVFADDLSRLEAALSRARTEGVAATEIRIVDARGDVLDMDCQLEWSSSSGSFFTIFKDISERKNMERAKAEFVSMISHDLKAPLSSIKLTLQALLNMYAGQIDAKGRVMIGASLKSIERMVAMIMQMLDMDRAETGNLVLEKKPTPVNDLFADALASVETTASAKGVLLEAVPSNSGVLADKQRIVQVLVNLLANAIKFTDAGKRVRLYVSDGPDTVTFHVRDEGRGIPSAYKKIIFERFKQVDVQDATEHQGSGLGLPICKTLVEAHGGRLSVDSSEGKGSTFSFVLERAG